MRAHVASQKREPPSWMCASCHKKGTRHLWPIEGHNAKHGMVTRQKLPCGQCGKRRQLLQCHEYDFRRKHD